MQTLRLPATAESRAAFRRFVVAKAVAAGVTPAILSKVELVLEELLVNHTNHAYRQGPGDSVVTCLVPSPEIFSLKLVDRGRPFDPLAQPGPELSNDLDERAIGGLGLHLVRRLASRVAYERTGHENIVTVEFPIQPAAAVAGGPGT